MTYIPWLWPRNGWDPFAYCELWRNIRRPLRCNHQSCDIVAVLTRSGLIFGAINTTGFGASRKVIINSCTVTAAMSLLRATKIIRCGQRWQTLPRVPPPGHLDQITLSVFRLVQPPGKLDKHMRHL